MSLSYNAFHAPIGAHSSFTLGCLGQNGGLGLELGGPADQNVYIGVETRAGGSYEALPFFAGSEDETARYDHEAKGRKKGAEDSFLRAFRRKQIRRDYRLSVDTWSAGDLSFTVYSPVLPVPDPAKASRAEMQRVLRPSVLAELTIDNRKGRKARTTFFGYAERRSNDAMRTVADEGGLTGVGLAASTGIFTESGAMDARAHMGFQNTLTEQFPENFRFGLGGCGLPTATVPAGKKRSFRFAICFYRAGVVTQGMETSYLT